MALTTMPDAMQCVFGRGDISPRLRLRRAWALWPAGHEFSWSAEELAWVAEDGRGAVLRPSVLNNGRLLWEECPA